QVNDDEPPSYQDATAGKREITIFYLRCLCPGYEEMQAQFSWDDKTIRRTFIRKVYAILMVQLLVTVAIISLFTFCIFMSIQYSREITRSIFYIITIIIYSNRRQFPWNIILLVLFVMISTFLVSNVNVLCVCSCCSFYNTKSVLLCVGITAMVCLAVTIFSFQSKVDVTSCQGVLFSLCIVMLLCAITISIAVPFGYIPWLHAVYAVIGAILFTLFLAFDTQMLMGNKRYAISPEEYIFATLSLYLDIIYLFSFLLQITGQGRE
uniref:Protein lifeguard 2 n=1 Tax=Cynoglossus semilaevis TaxID=244447 RepID=A0A3P8V064_CYNSE